MKKFLTVMCLFALSSSASANFVATDWKNTGDGLATLDSHSGLEWLDITQTYNQSYNAVAARLQTDLAGWRFPTYEELVGLFSRVVPSVNPTAGLHPLVNSTASPIWQNAVLFNNLFATSLTSNPRWVQALFEKDGVIKMAGFYMSSTSVQYWSLENQYTFSRTNPISTKGVFLVSDGGVTLSSINNPDLNINNPSAPVNNPPEPPPVVTDVNSPAAVGLLLSLGLMLLGIRVRRVNRASLG